MSCVAFLPQPGITVVDAFLEKMSMTEQLQLAQRSCVFLGAHGYDDASTL
jgi:hypothetical protein